MTVEDLSAVLGVMAAWDDAGETEYGLCYADPRLPALGMRCMLPPHLAAEAAADLGAMLVEASEYEAHRIALGAPRGGLDFQYNDTFPHEADMDQLNGIDFEKGCYVGQEVISRVEHRGTARKRVVPVTYEDFAAEAGVPVMVGEMTDRHDGVLGARTRACDPAPRPRRRSARGGHTHHVGRQADYAGPAGLGALRMAGPRKGRGVTALEEFQPHPAAKQRCRALQGLDRHVSLFRIENAIDLCAAGVHEVGQPLFRHAFRFHFFGKLPSDNGLHRLRG